ncbi:hypothetical protein BO70DRAFT_428317 [Aspergillus heteromorphus CBS 117.55]|uniref:gamma-glutamylcyclotransferase n=1 Tax=Aspergillus heteromorphus CBS 117.55 TaxID=1448321 RepID=A0A317WIZ1_9EURO|nr:uncharacterized protein BO70DRAFT_428317 [Aspergillus heteromorphus CBS 117.55]PWY86279.1 hypothetical protein BO70DRAFT_428317 [Aspergillus heteromorphus CBS 117.55]
MSSFRQSCPSPDESRAGGLYFAYGSNMHLQQMAARYPDSTLFARGILRNYRWQTNTRGGGNVVEGSQDDFVEGIMFRVSTSDVQALRHYEGVAQQNFTEMEFDIEVERFPDTRWEGRKTTDAARILAGDSTGFRMTEPESLTDAPEHNRAERVHRKALVYVSYKYQVPGDIRDEYMARMQLAMDDARMLGVSEYYLEALLHPQVFGKTRPVPVESLSLQAKICSQARTMPQAA